MIIGRSGRVGCYALCGDAAEKTFKVRNQDIKGKGGLTKTAISLTEWSYGLTAMHYC